MLSGRIVKTDSKRKENDTVNAATENRETETETEKCICCWRGVKRFGRGEGGGRLARLTTPLET